MKPTKENIEVPAIKSGPDVVRLDHSSLILLVNVNEHLGTESGLGYFRNLPGLVECQIVKRC